MQHLTHLLNPYQILLILYPLLCRHLNLLLQPTQKNIYNQNVSHVTCNVRICCDLQSNNHNLVAAPSILVGISLFPLHVNIFSFEKDFESLFESKMESLERNKFNKTSKKHKGTFSLLLLKKYNFIWQI